jgi:hypothetical protein
MLIGNVFVDLFTDLACSLEQHSDDKPCMLSVPVMYNNNIFVLRRGGAVD